MTVMSHDFPLSDAEAQSISELESAHSWLDSFSVVRKIRLAVTGNIIALSLFVLAIVGIIIVNLQDVEELAQLAEAQIDLGNSTVALAQGGIALKDANPDGQTEALESFQLGSQLLSQTVANNDQLPEEVASEISDFEARITVLQESIASASSPDDLQASYAMTQSLISEMGSYSRSLQEFGKTWADGVFSIVSISMTILAVILIIAQIASFLVARWITRNVAGMIEKVTESAEALAAGNVSAAIPGRHRQDEIGALARALAVFRDTTQREMSQKVKLEEEQEKARVRQAEARQEKVDALRRISQDFEASVGKSVEIMAAGSVEVSSNADAIAKITAQVRSEVTKSADTMDETSIGVSAAAAASDEFALSISEINKQAGYSADLAREAGLMANSANEKINLLSLHADEIGEIVELIQTIAQRTNLLALNASIEAARGGEAGRGFAVVASEVKELAAQTARATEQVSEKIATIQGSTDGGVEALKTVVDQIKKLEVSSVSIASAVDQQSLTGRDLAKNIDLAARNTDAISSILNDIEKSASAAGKATDQMRGSADALEKQAGLLRAKATQFLETIEETTTDNLMVK